jgi:hypothetical protein
MSLAVLLLLVGAVAASAGEEHKMHQMEPKEVTLAGEVLDLYCFMNHPDTGMGEGHAKCAKSCINKGLPIGFLSDGVVYLIIGKDHEPAAEMVAEFAGMQSEITGTFVEHHGVKAIEIASIKAKS